MKADEGGARPLKGPRTLEETMRGITQRGAGGFMGGHHRWVVESRIDPSSRSAIEHKVVSKSMHLAMFVEALNVKNCISMEYLNRRRQLIQEAHREDVTRPNFEGAHCFMGDEDEGMGVHLAPSLRAHLAQQFS